MSAYTVLRRKPVRVELFRLREVFGVFVYHIGRHPCDGPCWNDMTVSKINFFNCFPGMNRDRREKSHSLFENLKHKKIHTDVTQVVGGQQLQNVSWLVCKDSVNQVDIFRHNINV
jgi:hypothetical protein